MTASGPDKWAVKGDPTPEELAAVVAVLSARPSAAAAPPAVVVSRWNDRGALLRKPLAHGPGAWKAARSLR